MHTCVWEKGRDGKNSSACEYCKSSQWDVLQMSWYFNFPKAANHWLFSQKSLKSKGGKLKKTALKVKEIAVPSRQWSATKWKSWILSWKKELIFEDSRVISIGQGLFFFFSCFFCLVREEEEGGGGGRRPWSNSWVDTGYICHQVSLFNESVMRILYPLGKRNNWKNPSDK